MDYIQNDLDLIRMNSPEDVDSKESKKMKKTKMEKIHKKKLSKDGEDPSQKVGKIEKDKIKNRAKTLSPKKLKKDVEKLKEKAQGRKSIGGPKPGSLGKIKLPARKKQITVPVAASKVTSKAADNIEVEENPLLPTIMKPKAVQKIASPAVSTKSRKSIDPDAIPIKAIQFEEGAKIEAVDNGQWYKAKIVKVDNDKMDILVHFDGWGAKFDTWFPMTSNLIRGRTQLDMKVVMEKYDPGEDVLARWTDGNFYPATVLTVKDSGSCQVMYFDGMKKLLRPNMMKKMSEKEKATAMKAIEQLLLLPPSVIDSPLSSAAGSPSSDGTSRRYKTSANDRERRIAARGGKSTPRSTTRTPDSELSQSTKPKKATKRRASQMLPTKPESPSQQSKSRLPVSTPTPIESRLSSGDENFHAKKARLDKITNNLVNKVSPTSKSDSSTEQRDASPDDSDSDSPLVIDEEMDSKSQLAARKKRKPENKSEIQGARGPGAKKRGRPKAPVPRPRIVTKITKVHQGQESSLHVSQSRFEEKRQQASEALLQLSQATTSTSYTTGASTSTATLPYHSVDESNVLGKNSNFQHAGLDYENLNEDNDSNESREDQSYESNEVSATSPNYKTGDIVLAKWADCRSYLAYIVEKEEDDSYKIRYYDGMVKIVKSSFIHPWVGPLPDALKSFKPKVPQARKHKHKSSNIRLIKKKDKNGKIEKREKIVEKKRTTSLSKAENAQSTRTRRRTESGDGPTDTINFSDGEKVLAKWTDFKWYPATVIKKTDKLHYEVKYLDDLTRIVRDTWITPWKPPAATTSISTKIDDKSSLTGQKSTQVTEIPPVTKSSELVKLPHSGKTTDPNETANSQGIDSTEKESKGIAATEKRTELKESDNEEQDTKETPEEGSITESGDVVGLGEQAIKTYEKFVPGDTVLARWTDCRSYPATIIKVLDNGGKYVVEYYDGMQKELKPTMLKSWNPSALPPTTKQVYRRPMTKIRQDPSKKQPALSIKDKVGRLTTAARQSQQGPRQVVRGYDAYYARLPAPAHDVAETNHHKFKCRVPGCTKSFRKEDMLRTHHKYYHQQRYKLRVQDSQPAPIKRKSSKEDNVVRRRVSADYEIAKAQARANIAAAHADQKDASQTPTLRSRGAKPPIDVYKQQHGNVSLSSASSMLDTSSGQDDAKLKDETKSIELEVDSASSLDPVFRTVKRRGSRKISGRSASGADTEEKKNSPQVVASQSDGIQEPVNEPGEQTENGSSINEDVIRCTCDVEEEEGFMIQCEGCFTWQHASCVGVSQPDKNKRPNKSKQRKNSKAKDDYSPKSKQPEKISPTAADAPPSIDDGYICWVCKNPQNVRKSKKYSYNNDYLTKGKLPSLSELNGESETVSQSPRRNVVNSLMLSSLMDEVVKMQDVLTGIKQKIKIATMSNEHPYLDTWKETVKSGKIHHSSSQKISAENYKKDQISKTEDREAYIRQCRENLLDHITDLESELDNRITLLTNFVSSIDNDDRAEGEQIKGVENLQKGLTAVQKLLSYC
uniref:uncharacterized protein LOC120336924 isoform X3 n=1 Tax=Styela clava TaxID=7725 RepID=UPI00193AAA39|nr:uncharacterized protein LOC120336924 isoform X3 [Styela clava]